MSEEAIRAEAFVFLLKIMRDPEHAIETRMEAADTILAYTEEQEESEAWKRG